MKTSLTMLRTEQFGWRGQLEIARAGDRYGYERLWVTEAYGYDAFTQLAAYATVTDRIGLATGIISVFGRSPAAIAQTAATLDMLSYGRFLLGLGTSSSVLATEWHGVPFDDALSRLKESIQIVRMILAKEKLVHHGRFFDMSAGLRMQEKPVRASIPIYVGALTPAGMRLTGELADGWIATFFSPQHFDTVVAPSIQHGLERRASSLKRLKICVFQTVVVADQLDLGRDAVRANLALYVGAMGKPERNYYGKLFRRYGFADQVDLIQSLYQQRRRDEAVAALTDEMIDSVTIIGPVERCRARLLELEVARVDEVALEVIVPGAPLEGFVSVLAQLAPSTDARVQ